MPLPTRRRCNEELQYFNQSTAKFGRTQNAIAYLLCRPWIVPESVKSDVTGIRRSVISSYVSDLTIRLNKSFIYPICVADAQLFKDSFKRTLAGSVLPVQAAS
jgi:hypothetical protein